MVDIAACGRRLTTYALSRFTADCKARGKAAARSDRVIVRLPGSVACTPFARGIQQTVFMRNFGVGTQADSVSRAARDQVRRGVFD